MKSFETLKQLHPCMSDSLGEYGRIHLPVSPVCNLSCRYCKRSFSTELERPGRSRGILPVNKVLKTMERALALCPEITTVGIAGPGDTLASDHAMETFRLIDKNYPQMIKCMSTNGLLLSEKAEALAEVHVDSVTVTVNAIDPSIEAKINDRIWYQGKWINSIAAAETLIDHQMEGIRKAAEKGIIVKINTVLIPGINDRHIESIAAHVADAGARIYNIIPLIPQANMQDIPRPECSMIDKARAQAKAYLDVFQHCQHCRADAVGRLGKEDFGKMIYGDLEPAEEHFSHG